MRSSIFFRNVALSLVFTVGYASTCGYAGSLSISNVPLGTGAGVSVKPNLMFILDDSGSMDSNFLPEYVNDDGRGVGDPPFASSAFNLIWYNPAVLYLPPKNGDGTSKPNASTTAPLVNGFDSSSTSAANLSANQDRAWCKKGFSPTGKPATDANCIYYQDGVAQGYPPASTVYTSRKTYYTAPYPYYYVMSGRPQWCTDTTYSSCASKRSSTYGVARFSANAGTTGVQAYRSFYITKAGGTKNNSTTTLSSICAKDDSSSSSCGGNNILSSAIVITGQDVTSNRNALANAIVSKVGGGYTAQLLQSEGAGCPLTVTACAQVKIMAPGGTTSITNTAYNNVYVNVIDAINIAISNGSTSANVGMLTGGVDYVPSNAAVTFTRMDIKPGREYPKSSARTDCVGTTCTYAEEIQNYANWYSYYGKRLSMVKSSVSHAFSSISNTSPGAGFRIGLMTIGGGTSITASCATANRNLELPIADFDATQKTAFYDNLFAISKCDDTYTPLRGALSRVGRLYAGKLSNDPVQYSCQQNFSFLSTDGYWNSDTETSSFGPQDIDGNNVGDQDGSGTARPQLDGLGLSNTLADVAMYYYKTDLRPSLTDDVPKSSKDSATHQHMVTFTMGLGMDGTLAYSPDYETGGSADFTAINQGTKDWPDPIANVNEERIDDLWHAAVNGRGKYFSAKSPGQVSSALTEALQGVSAMSGAAAAAATSNLEPVAGDNFAYVASYVTQTWEGNIEAKAIDLTTGVLSSDSIWVGQSLLDSQAAVSPVPSGASGPGSRKLYSYKASQTGSDKKVLLTWSNVQSSLKWDGSVSGSDYFDPAQLPQCSSMTNCPGATRQNLFEYLMGGTDTTSNKSYRSRSHVLGDVVNSQPVYVKLPSFAYADTGYSAFKTGSTRKAMVYVGANDGFLHAFDASTGNEDWAYLPAALAPQLYGLASSSYPHRYYVDGTITVGDVPNGSTWKTILVGGLNSGGRSYYALDVTDPTSPLALWEFSDARMGYSYGNPIITKLPAGTKSPTNVDIGGKWVVLVTTGYNNGSGSTAARDGQGALIVLDAYTGTEYFRVYTCIDQADSATCSGSPTSPNGLAKINNWVQDPLKDNTTLYVYGGDLEGGLWRFDLKAKSAFKVAAVGEPITVKPELATVYGQKAIYFGTGLFLQASDKSDHGARTVFAIKDDLSATSPLVNVKTSDALVEQELAFVTDSTTKRTIKTPKAVDWATKSGWFVRLPEAGERVNVDPKIQLGTLVVASNVPDDTGTASCTTGGHAWLNYFDIYSGSYVTNSQSNSSATASDRIGNAVVVGVNIVRLPNGKLMAISTTSDNKHPVNEVAVGSSSLPVHRVSWRELTTD